MTLFVDNPAAGKGTHALVIGVGAYPRRPWGLTDLDGATASALAFVEWLQEDFPKEGAPPLATVELLLSPSPGGPAIPPNIASASMPNVQQAVGDWFARCNTSEENLALFYFCGHGFEKGLTSSVLCEDFGRHPLPLDIMQEAIDVEGFYQGMETCLARSQCFIIDACRNMPAQLVPLRSMGIPIIAPDIDGQPTDTDRDLAILYGTSSQHHAYGAPGKVSQFTSALLEALRGAAWDDHENPWNMWSLRVERMIPAVNEVLKLQEKHAKTPRQRAQMLSRMSGILLMRTRQAPSVPVVVVCDPEASTAQTALRVHRNGQVFDQRDAGAEGAWRIRLPADAKPYDVEARIDAAAAQETLVVRPPCREAVVRVPR